LENRNREAKRNGGEKKGSVSQKVQTGKAKHKGTKSGLYLRGLKKTETRKPKNMEENCRNWLRQKKSIKK
jgi:hypothetical protein